MKNDFVKLDANSNELPADATDHVLVLDRANGLIWTADNLQTKQDDEDDSEQHNFEAAEFAINKCAIAGFTDWRLPTIDELSTLIDRTRFKPATNIEFFPSTRNDYYWSNTPCAWAPGSGAWIVDFSLGFVGGNDRDGTACVRAVRSVSPPSQ